jgi:hypothetical protein
MASDSGTGAPDSERTRPGLQPAAVVEGTVVGRYLVLELLGEGGMGVVHRAYDPDLDRHVALKLLHARPTTGSGGDEARARLLREAKVMARLDHPNVVRIHDVGEAGDRVYLAMDLVEGTTLKQFMRERKRSLGELLDVFVRAGRGLAAAHDAGLVHRDFKPDNVLIARDGDVFVTDFGLARVAAALDRSRARPLAAIEGGHTREVTLAGTVVGTPSYMAPEQLSGESVDARSDQFSFCVALWEAAYGSKPFVGESIDRLVSAIMRHELAATPAGSRVPGWLRRMLVRGLAPHRRDRHPSMHALLVGLVTQPRRRRNFARVGAVAAVLVAAAVVSRVRAATDACAVDPTALAGAWDDARRDRLGAAVLAADPRSGATIARALTGAIDRQAAAWLDTRAAVCASTSVHGEQSAEARAVRDACLDRSRERIAATADRLAGLDTRALGSGLIAVFEAPDPRICAVITAAGDHEPADPELVAAELALRTGDAAAAERMLASSPGEPEPARSILVGDLHRSRGDAASAAAAYREAALAAEAARLDRAAARAWTRLVAVTAESDPAAAPRLGVLASAAIVRAGEDRLHVELELALARASEDDVAEDHLARAAVLCEEQRGAEDPVLAAVLLAHGRELQRLGRHRDAIATELRALAITEQLHGRDHAAAAPILLALAEALEGSGAPREAAVHRERARALAGGPT